jgi:hypothetical protein
MEILPGIEIKGKALWHAKKKILIIADIHIGYEEAMKNEGVYAPRTTFSELRKEIEEILLLKPKLIVVNGDIKHEFGRISNQEWKDAIEFLDLLLGKSRVILIKGNHDNFLEPIAVKRGVEVKDFYCFDDVCITHGHKIFIDRGMHSKNIKKIIIGHEHPAVSITDGVKTETYKCFLKGKWHKKTLVVMPSFFSVFEGSDVKRKKLLSPYLDEKIIGNFEVYIVGEKERVYLFGKLKGIK